MKIFLLVMTIISLSFLAFCIMIVLYENHNWFKKFFHDICHLHIPENLDIDYVVVGDTCKCKICGMHMTYIGRGEWVADDEH